MLRGPSPLDSSARAMRLAPSVDAWVIRAVLWVARIVLRSASRTARPRFDAGPPRILLVLRQFLGAGARPQCADVCPERADMCSRRADARPSLRICVPNTRRHVPRLCLKAFPQATARPAGFSRFRSGCRAKPQHDKAETPGAPIQKSGPSLGLDRAARLENGIYSQWMLRPRAFRRPAAFPAWLLAVACAFAVSLQWCRHA